MTDDRPYVDPSTALRAGAQGIALALREIADAARLAQALRDNACAIVVGGVHYGRAATSGMVGLSAYTQVLAANRAKDDRIAALEATIAALSATPAGSESAPGGARQDADHNEPEFTGDILEPAER